MLRKAVRCAPKSSDSWGVHGGALVFGLLKRRGETVFLALPDKRGCWRWLFLGLGVDGMGGFGEVEGEALAGRQGPQNPGDELRVYI